MNNKNDEILLHDYFDNLLSSEEQKNFEEYLLDNIDLAIELGKLKTLQRKLNNLPSSFTPNEIVIEHIYNSLLEDERKEAPENKTIEIESAAPKPKKKREEKNQKRLTPKNQYRLKKLLSVFIFFLAIGIIGFGYYFYDKQNKTTPWQVELFLQNNQNAELKSMDVNSILRTSKNEKSVITVADKGKIELLGDSKIQVVKGTQSLNTIIYDYGSLIYTPTTNNKLFRIKYKNILLESEQSKFEIASNGNDKQVSVLTNFISVTADGIQHKIPADYEFNILSDNKISVPVSKKSSAKFRKLVETYTVSEDDNILKRIINASAKKDVFTLHYLLSYVPPIYREIIIAKLQNLIPAISSIDKIKILLLDKSELNNLWNKIYQSVN